MARTTVAQLESRVDDNTKCMRENSTIIKHIVDKIDTIIDRDLELKAFLENGLSKRIAAQVEETRRGEREREIQEERERRIAELEEERRKNREYGERRDREQAEERAKAERNTKLWVSAIGAIAVIASALIAIFGG